MNISQKVWFPASPHAVYEVLMDVQKHADMTGEAADISRRVGGRFTAYGDYISGTNLELDADRKIVQKWRASDWPKGHFSIATFLIQREGKGTTIAFTQTDVPDDKADSIAAGWKEFYWDRMNAYFRKRKK